MVKAHAEALIPVTMNMWPPTRLPLEFAGVDIRISSPALQLAAKLDMSEVRELEEFQGPRLVCISDWSVMRVSAEPSPRRDARVGIRSAVERHAVGRIRLRVELSVGLLDERDPVVSRAIGEFKRRAVRPLVAAHNRQFGVDGHVVRLTIDEKADAIGSIPVARDHVLDRSWVHERDLSQRC